MTIIENYTRFAEEIAKDDRHGYDQVDRWGNPNFDCSGLVITALEQAGIPVKTLGATTTKNMASRLAEAGMKNVISMVSLASAKNLKRGDVLLAKNKHVVIYCGNGLVVGARLNEFGHVVGGKSGDQTGKEICIHQYYNYPWTHVFRYPVASQLASSSISVSSASAKTPRKSTIEIAKECIQGLHGNGEERRKKLFSLGYNYSEVQTIVNDILKRR